MILWPYNSVTVEPWTVLSTQCSQLLCISQIKIRHKIQNYTKVLKKRLLSSKKCRLEPLLKLIFCNYLLFFSFPINHNTKVFFTKCIGKINLTVQPCERNEGSLIPCLTSRTCRRIHYRTIWFSLIDFVWPCVNNKELKY